MSAPTQPLLWFTDRTHYEMGTGFCATARFLSKHAGPTGYGIVMKAESLPLATGQYVHQACAPLFTSLQQHNTLPSPADVRAAVVLANLAYEAALTERGFRGLLASDTTAAVIKEQQALLTGLIWALALKFLPWFHEQYTVVSVEEEHVALFTCDCGHDLLAPLDVHLEAGCGGIALQQRRDVVGRHRISGRLAYFEIKTTGEDFSRFKERWEIAPQLAVGILNAEQQYGAPIDELWVVGLYKGYREKVYNDQDQIIGQRQMSPFCTAYKRAGNPPLDHDDWRPSYRYTDESGKRKQLPKDYQKTPTWQLAESDWPTRASHPELDPVECWVRSLPEKTLEEQLYLVGPMNPQVEQAQALREQWMGEEVRWQSIVWQLYAHTKHTGEGWGTPSYHALLQRLVSASWACRRYGSAHQCQYLPLCLKQQGWEDPLGSGIYVPRRPHHAPELAQAIGRGLIAAEAQEVEEVE